MKITIYEITVYPKGSIVPEVRRWYLICNAEKVERKRKQVFIHLTQKKVA